MEIFISKQEVEKLNKEPKRVINGYRSKNSILAELIYIKAYNLLKHDSNLANKYINRVFYLSSFCKDFDLIDYEIEDIRILITFENNILSGFIYGKINGSTDVFANIIKISNDLILVIDKRNYSNVIRPSILTKLLNLSNIECIITLRHFAKEELTRRFNAEFEDKLRSNIFIASQFRKESFDNLPAKEKKKLLKINIKEEFSVGEYIYNVCKKTISTSINTSIIKMLNKIESNFSSDILNIDYLYKEISSCTDESIINCLTSRIPQIPLVNSPCLLIDLIFVKDELNVFKNRDIDLDNKLTRRRFISKKIDKINSILNEIDSEICSVYSRYIQKTFSINYGNSTNVRCNYYTLKEKKIEIEGYKYRVNCLYFYRLDGYGLILDNPLQLDNTINLSITYRKQLLYSVSEDKRNKLIAARKELIDIIDIKQNYNYID